MNTKNATNTEKLLDMSSKQSQENAGIEGNSNSNSNEIITREEIDHSPFTIITTDEGSFVVMGKARLTNTLSIEEARHWCNVITWDKLLQVIIVLKEHDREVEELTKKINNNE